MRKKGEDEEIGGGEVEEEEKEAERGEEKAENEGKQVVLVVE